MNTLDDFTGTLVLAGAGKMGGAMLQGWLARGLDPARVVVLEPQPSPEIAALPDIRINPDMIDDAAVFVIAVKPQMFAAAAPTFSGFVKPSTLVLSIMAGTPLHALAALGARAVVRAMPNTPAAIGRGITVAVASPSVSAEQRTIADTLLRATGAVEWIDDETLMDAVTAVSGSGPAYVFLLAEELTRAGIAAGLPEPLAVKLARDTVSGAGELLHRSDIDAATLRRNVTSPGGTTAAALAVLMHDDGMAQLMTRAVAAAAARSKELSG